MNIIIFLLVIFMATSAHADAVESRCSFGAFVQEEDPAGLNVRAAPELSASVIGILPPSVESIELDGYKVRVEVDVLGSQDGWFRIANAHDNMQLTGKPERTMFSGTGWVSGRKLTVKSQADKGHAGPMSNSPVTFGSKDGMSLDRDSLVAAAQLIGCEGGWAFVEFAQQKYPDSLTGDLIIDPLAAKGLPKGHFRTWLNKICGNQETSCDGLGAE